ncbi:DUF421 domain-containing protein [Gracilibacillus marinus]|uniref:DUF421 domain-containing protein n=1 Tax=Gracilibacillus marinus TaxID=630535 RepID=A0ABV8VVQ9_9BACI
MIEDLLIVVGRIITILPLLLLITLFMGKRAIGELPVFDFLVIITLASVVGADIADPNIHHLPTIIAVIAIGLLQKIVSHLKLANRTIGRFLTFEPTVVITNGLLLHKQLKKIGYSVDNILEMLRDKDVFDISEVKLAIIEANGSLTVLKRPELLTATKQDIGKQTAFSPIAYPVILEGTICTDILTFLHLNEQWLEGQLNQYHYTPSDIFFASVNEKNQLHLCPYTVPSESVPPIRH